MDLTIGRAVAAEYIRHFRPRAGHRTIRSVVPVLQAGLRREAGVAIDREGWMPRRPCWSRCASTWRWWQGCDDRAEVGWSGRRRSRIRVDARRRRAYYVFSDIGGTIYPAGLCRVARFLLEIRRVYTIAYRDSL